MTQLSEEDFNKHVESLKSNLIEEPKKLADEVNSSWREIQDNQYYFDRCKLKSKLLLIFHIINKNFVLLRILVNILLI